MTRRIIANYKRRFAIRRDRRKYEAWIREHGHKLTTPRPTTRGTNG